VINLDDDDEVAKIDEQVHDELNPLFSSYIGLNENSPKKNIEFDDDPSFTLVIVPLASYPPFTYDEQDWELDDLL
jgi:hypothetical protein